MSHPVRLVAALASLAAGGALALPVAPAAADSTFHTAQLPLNAVGGSGITGRIIDIHVQGPQIYAQERYTLHGGTPGTTYAVDLLVGSDERCSALTLFAQTATMTANRAGNAAGRHTFHPIGLAPGTLFLTWQVVQGGQVVAQTACTAVAVD